MTKVNHKRNAKDIADHVVKVGGNIFKAAEPFFKPGSNLRFFALIAETKLNTDGWYATTIGGKKIFFEV